MSTQQATAPKDRAGFNIAIICALSLESDAVEGLFDQFYENDDFQYSREPNDPNSYTLGRIGRHNVVLAYMPGMGQINSTTVAAYFNHSFPNIRLGLVVGVTGGVPTPPNGDQIFLGDVIISTGIIQTDFGRQFAEGLIPKDTLMDNLGRPSTAIRTFLVQSSGFKGKMDLRRRTKKNIDDLLAIEHFRSASYPGLENDLVFAPDYRHKHHAPGSCDICDNCQGEEDPVCELARGASCNTLKCDNIVHRDRSGSYVNDPQFFFGVLGSSSAVMKSSFHRDRWAKAKGIIGFEMEGAGVWDNFPTIVVKGVCDYSDSHKNKKWQPYAAVTGAAAAKALLLAWRGVEGEGASANIPTAASTTPAAPATGTGGQPANPGGHVFSGTFTAGRNQNIGQTYNVSGGNVNVGN